jgi:hypothetical protein
VVRLVIGSYRIRDGKLEDHTQLVEFDGEELARHRWETSPFAGVRQRLFRTSTGRLIVSVATWMTRPRQETIYTLHEATEDDLQTGGQYAALGAALRSEALTLTEALTLQQALAEVERILEGKP